MLERAFESRDIGNASLDILNEESPSRVIWPLKVRSAQKYFKNIKFIVNKPDSMSNVPFFLSNVKSWKALQQPANGSCVTQATLQFPPTIKVTADL